MQFSTGVIAQLIIEPLRYFFTSYGQSSNLVWNPDEKLRTLDISESFDENKIPLQNKPRIIVSRGGFSVEKTGLTDNLAESRSIGDTLGIKDYTNLLFYSGTAVVTVEARNKGTCELLTDMVLHFLAWSRPIICDSQGFHEFGLPMMVSDCNMQTDEDPELPKYQVQIQVPWRKEELWQHRGDGVTLKKVISSVVPSY